uniref:Uncharacterized protein n=1 Tax=Oryza nivara TaxID=4536 RepID=A0A0E0IAV9_ORYNI
MPSNHINYMQVSGCIYHPPVHAIPSQFSSSSSIQFPQPKKKKKKFFHSDYLIPSHVDGREEDDHHACHCLTHGHPLRLTLRHRSYHLQSKEQDVPREVQGQQKLRHDLRPRGVHQRLLLQGRLLQVHVHQAVRRRRR